MFTLIFGLTRVEIHGDSLYFLITIVDFSRTTWAHILKHKVDTFEKFKEFHIPIRNQLRAKMECSMF